jgi:predicted Zn-dependent protease
MRLKRWLILLSVLGFFAFLIWGFLQIVPWLGLKFISAEREEQLGKQMFRALTANETVDRRTTAWVQEFANELQLSKDYRIKVYVVESKVENAYALPGGYIVIYSSMLKSIDKPEEFAALLGHEASHINHRHSLRSMLKDLASGLLLSMVVGDANGIVGILLSNADQLRSLSYSRKLETEADVEGMNLLLKNKIDIQGMTMLLETLKDDTSESDSHISFLSTHPLTEDRISKANAFINQHRNQNIEPSPSLSAAWLQIKK